MHVIEKSARPKSAHLLPTEIPIKKFELRRKETIAKIVTSTPIISLWRGYGPNLFRITKRVRGLLYLAVRDFLSPPKHLDVRRDSDPHFHWEEKQMKQAALIRMRPLQSNAEDAVYEAASTQLTVEQKDSPHTLIAIFFPQDRCIQGNPTK